MKKSLISKLWMLMLGILLGGFLLIAAPFSEASLEEEKELFFVAQSAFDDGFYDVAMRYIEEFLQKYPQSEKKTQVLLLSGQCYFFKNQYLKAFNTFQDLLKYSEYKDATLFWLGETYLKGSDFAQAEKHYQQVIKLYPNSVYTPQAYYSLGWAYFEQKKYTESSESFSKLTKQFPDHQLSEDSVYKIAECAYNQGDYFKSVELFKRYLLKYPQTNRSLQVDFFIAESYYYQEKYVEANIYYKKVQETSQDVPMIVASIVSQGWGYLKMKDYSASIEAFNKAEGLATEKGVLTDDIYLGKASFYSETGDGPQALGAYRKMIELFPNSTHVMEAHLGIANVYYSMQKYDEAIREYKVVIEKGNPSDGNQEIVEKANFGLAWTYLKMGLVDQSIASFKDVLDKTKSATVKVSALTQIGDAYQDMSQWDKAVEVYDKILKEFPESVYADYVQYRQGIALLKLSKIELATIAFQSLQQNFPKSKYLADINYYLGVAYFKKGDWSAAFKTIESFLKNPNHPKEFTPEANYVLALCMLNLSKAEDAIKLFQKIIKNFPENTAIVRNSEVGTAKAYHSLGQSKEAVRRFKLILYKFPDTDTEEDCLFWLGQFYFKSGDYPGSIEYYEKLSSKLKNKEKIGILHFELGQAYELNKEYEKALSEYRKIPASDKEMSAKGGLAIAGIFSKELDPDKAAETYQKIIDTNAEFRRDAYLKLAQVYRRSSEFEKEAQTYQEALSTSKGVSVVTDVQLQFFIGDAYEAMSAWEKAIEAYLKIPYLYKDESAWAVKAYLRVARIFENNEDWDNARMTYQKVLTYQTEEAKYAQERIDRINTMKVKKK